MKNKLKIVLSICEVLLGVVVLVESIFTQQYLPPPVRAVAYCYGSIDIFQN